MNIERQAATVSSFTPATWSLDIHRDYLPPARPSPSRVLPGAQVPPADGGGTPGALHPYYPESRRQVAAVKVERRVATVKGFTSATWILGGR